MSFSLKRDVFWTPNPYLGQYLGIYLVILSTTTCNEQNKLKIIDCCLLHAVNGMQSNAARHTAHNRWKTYLSRMNVWDLTMLGICGMVPA